MRRNVCLLLIRRKIINRQIVLFSTERLVMTSLLLLAVRPMINIDFRNSDERLCRTVKCHPGEASKDQDFQSKRRQIPPTKAKQVCRLKLTLDPLVAPDYRSSALLEHFLRFRNPFRGLPGPVEIGTGPEIAVPSPNSTWRRHEKGTVTSGN